MRFITLLRAFAHVLPSGGLNEQRKRWDTFLIGYICSVMRRRNVGIIKKPQGQYGYPIGLLLIKVNLSENKLKFNIVFV